MRLLTLLLCCLALVSMSCGAQTYRAHDGTRVRRPHVYRRHPNAATAWTARCRDGSVSFSRHRAGTCSHHGGVAAWR